MSAAERLAAEHRERLEHFRRHAERVREADIGRIAVDIFGVPPDRVVRALRGNLTRDDDEDDPGARRPPDTRPA